MSFQWGGLKFRQVVTGQYPASIELTPDIDPAYSQGLFTDDNKYYMVLAWRQEGWNEDRLKGEFSDYLAKTYPSQRRLILPDRTSVTESVFMPENVTIQVLPAFNLRLLTKNGHSVAFLISHNTLVFSNNPPALFNLLLVDK